MDRVINIKSTSAGEHFVDIGLDSSRNASFRMRMWIERVAKRHIDWIQPMSLGFVSFMGGNVYLHNSNDVPRNNLYGEQKVAKIGVVVNENATVTKILDSIALYTNGEWEVESLVIPADLNYPAGMYSVIPASFFKKREGVLYSEFLRNGMTSSGTVNPVEYLNGEELRCNSAYLVLKHTGGEDIQLWKIDIKAQTSR